MEGGGGSGGGALSLDCEDMFKEITKKLYGEEAGGVGVEFPAAEREPDPEPEPEEHSPEEHITAWGLAALMQHGVPPPGILQPNFQPRTDPAAEDRWSAADEPLGWAASRIAAYNPAQRLFKCCECECVGFLARVAEHWLGAHWSRSWACPLAACGFSAAWARAVRLHLARDHHADPAAADHLLRDNPALDDLTRYLQRLKAKVDAARNERRVEPVPVQQEVPSGASAGGAGGAGAVAGGEAGGKRYVCGACPYATDRRDLFTRHENIHRDEKPFHCYLCTKQFNRADHVKKHFLRMHRDQPYDLNRIRRSPGKPPVPALPAPAPPPQHYYVKPPPEPPPALEYRPPLPAPIKMERAPLAKAEPPPAPPSLPLPPPQLTQKPAVASAVGAAGAMAAVGAAAGGRRKGERRYACCYCAWSGADNWCLKRHLNTHLKPFACALCEYKAARAERLATHVHKVHNKKACARCPFLADDQLALQHHLRDAHHIESRNLKVPGVSRGSTVTFQTSGAVGGGGGAAGGAGGIVGVVVTPGSAGVEAGPRRRQATRAVGAARLFGYLEASDGSGDEYEPPLEFPSAAPPAPGPASTSAAAPAPSHFPRDKENAAPLQLHEHCLRY